MHRAFIVAASIWAFTTHTALAQTPTPQPLATMTKDQVQGIVKEYLMSNPEVVVDALNAYQEKKAKEASEKTQSVIKEKSDSLLKNTELPATGASAKDADIIIAEFFDYHCGYCKHMLPVITELVGTDKKIRVVFHELPILSDESTMAAKAALAVNSIKPDKYFDYHTALMKINGKLDQATLLAEAKKLGISEKDFNAAVSNPEIQKQLDSSKALARDLGISGTPAFIIGNEFIPGAGSLDSFKQIITQQRNPGSAATPASAPTATPTPAPAPAQ